MPKIKISKIAKDFNIALSTAVEFLRKKDIQIEDNPNARVDEEAYAMLSAEFDPDGKLAARAAKSAAPTPRPQTPEPPKQKKATAPQKPEPKPEPEKQPEPEPEIPIPTGPKVIGHIDLDAKPAHKEEQKKEESRKEEPRKEEPKEEKLPPREAPKEEPEKKEPEKKETHETQKVHEVHETHEIHESHEVLEGTNTQEQPREQPQQPAQKEEVFSMGRPSGGPTINIIGKIDLSTINSSTRPKKKTKEERRNERINKQGSQSGTNSQGDRKKRKRISGKEKVDIEKSAQQASQSSAGRQQASQSGSRRDGRNAERSRRPAHNEVNEEDVQKQVKETLARLTNKDKGQKKAAKWRKEKREAFHSREREAAELEAAQSKTLKLTEFVTANDLASMMDVPVNNIIATCMNLGVMVSINQRLDAETINIVADEFGFTTEYVSSEVSEAINQEADREEDLETRPPIVTVMGHVDHGKTSLLDYIRNANVIAGEAGGITQHIGAYNVKLSDGRRITFLDTPGHEAFTAMRARGAKVTDIVIVIVAADDNVMPQTVEALNHASAAGVPIVFAINKIDKPHANPDKIKEELAGMNYLVEEWGGKYQSQDISAKKGTGVDELMGKVLLEAELLELKANPSRNATGSIIESSLDKGRGYVATVLVQNGTLRIGDTILAGSHFGKVKAMFNERNQRITEAGPATPALILGLNGAPTAGDTFNVMDTEQEAREIANKREQLQRELGLRTKKILTLDDIGRRRAIGNFQELNIIVKGDVDGSIEALSDSLIKLSTEEIQVNVLHKAVGEISESDVTLAAASDAVIIGFQVRPSMAARREAEREGVEIRLYSVIYQAIEEVKDAMAGMLAPEIKEEVTGTAEVLQTFNISKVGTIAGAIVREGRIKRSCKVRLIRDGIVRYTGDLGSLKRMKDDVKEVVSGYDCGISIAGYNDIREGDMIEAFEEIEIKKSL